VRAALVLLALGGLVVAAAPGSAARLRECGSYASSDALEVRQGKSRCLVQAFRKGAPASLAVSRLDRSGSILTEKLFRVLGARRLELFVDVRKDRLGAQRWDRFVCRKLVARAGSLAPRRCVETPLTATGSESVRHAGCGRFVRFGPSTAEEREGYRCLVGAFQRGQPAQLVVTWLTVEGDPITDYIAVLGPQRVERLVDATKDRYSIPQWHRFLCGLVVLDARGLNFRDCRASVLPETFPRR
jgi:hypothetical protein